MILSEHGTDLLHCPAIILTMIDNFYRKTLTMAASAINLKSNEK
jgi:hypothetical protein